MSVPGAAQRGEGLVLYGRGEELAVIDGLLGDAVGAIKWHESIEISIDPDVIPCKSAKTGAQAQFGPWTRPTAIRRLPMQQKEASADLARGPLRAHPGNLPGSRVIGDAERAPTSRQPTINRISAHSVSEQQ